MPDSKAARFQREIGGFTREGEGKRFLEGERNRERAQSDPEMFSAKMNYITRL